MTYAKQSSYWQNRRIDWLQAYGNVDHPHRDLILDALSSFTFRSVLELGCGAGANLHRINKQWPVVELAGCDINNEAITAARELTPSVHYLETAPAHKVFFGDKSTDIVLTDAVLIYYSPKMLRKLLRNITKMARVGIVFCELHSANPLDRLTARYYLHNYPKVLEQAGFYDISLTKITNWPGKPWEKWGYIIKASIV